MSESTPDYVTEEQARSLLAEVKSFRQEWAVFAIHSKDRFDAFREKGASLPDDFFQNYNSLITRKTALASSIAESVAGVDQEVWSPPTAHDSLHEFEHKLEDLIKVAKELSCVIAAKRDRVIGVFNEVKSLKSTDGKIDKVLAGLRDDADREIKGLNVRVARLADVELDDKVQSLTSLLSLANDARSRLTGSASEAASLTSAECQAGFEAVSARFGIAVAIEALRTGLTNAAQAKVAPSVEIQSVVSAPADAVRPSAAPALRSETAAVSSGTTASAASKAAIQSLVNNLTTKPHPVTLPQRRPGAFTPIHEPNSVPLSTLADAGNHLKIKAHGLYPNALDPSQLDGPPSAIKNRAMGYGALATMIEIVGFVFTERERNRNFLGKNLHDILLLFAEVQNVVRVDAEQAGKPSLSEQVTAFMWLKHTCSEDGEKILIEKFMRLEDRSDPAKNPDLARRVLRLQKQLDTIRENEQVYSQLRKLCQGLSSGSDSDAFGMELPLWSQVNESVTQLIAAGLKPSDTKLRDVLLPIIDNLPEPVLDESNNVISEGVEISNEFRQVINSMYDYLATAEAPASPDSKDLETAAVAQVGSMLSGQTMVIIGGVCKPHAAQRLKRKLKLGEVRWIEATKQDRVSEFRSDLNGAAIVVLVTKLIGHKHNDVRDMCRDANIPWVQTRHSSGYSTNQIAATILEQASEQLQLL